MEEKKWWLSKTLWGAACLIAAFLLTWLGVEVTPEEQQTFVDMLVEVLDKITALVGLVLVIIGRFKANTHLVK